MTIMTFIAFHDELVGKELLNSTRNTITDEQLAIFFYVDHDVANKVIAETFQYSGKTISRHFNNVLHDILMPNSSAK